MYTRVVGHMDPVDEVDVENNNTRSHSVSECTTPRLLDLFSGTGSVGRVFAAHGYEVVSLDCEVTFAPTICVDILEWDYQSAFPPGYFDVIACGVPCTEFSRALTTRPRNLELANRIVQHTLKIVEYFRPRRWFLENPRSGLLKVQDYMQGYAFVSDGLNCTLSLLSSTNGYQFRLSCRY